MGLQRHAGATRLGFTTHVPSVVIVRTWAPKRRRQPARAKL